MPSLYLLDCGHAFCNTLQFTEWCCAQEAAPLQEAKVLHQLHQAALQVCATPSFHAPGQASFSLAVSTACWHASLRGTVAMQGQDVFIDRGGVSISASVDFGLHTLAEQDPHQDGSVPGEHAWPGG